MSEIVLYDNILAVDSNEAGICWDKLGAAISCWAFMQSRPVSVADAARAFNTTPQIAEEAVGHWAWTFISSESDDPEEQIIEHEGE
jgi:hypothetical protein